MQRSSCVNSGQEWKAIKEMKFSHEEKTDDADALFFTDGSDYGISEYPWLWGNDQCV